MMFQKRIFLLVLVTLVAYTCANLTPCDTKCLSHFYQCFDSCTVVELCDTCIAYKSQCLQNCGQSNNTRKRRDVNDAPSKITDIQGMKKYLNLQWTDLTYAIWKNILLFKLFYLIFVLYEYILYLFVHTCTENLFMMHNFKC